MGSLSYAEAAISTCASGLTSSEKDAPFRRGEVEQHLRDQDAEQDGVEDAREEQRPDAVFPHAGMSVTQSPAAREENERRT